MPNQELTGAATCMTSCVASCHVVHMSICFRAPAFGTRLFRPSGCSVACVIIQIHSLDGFSPSLTDLGHPCNRSNTAQIEAVSWILRNLSTPVIAMRAKELPSSSPRQHLHHHGVCNRTCWMRSHTRQQQHCRGRSPAIPVICVFRANAVGPPGVRFVTYMPVHALMWQWCGMCRWYGAPCKSCACYITDSPIGRSYRHR